MAAVETKTIHHVAGKHNLCPDWTQREYQPTKFNRRHFYNGV